MLSSCQGGKLQNVYHLVKYVSSKWFRVYAIVSQATGTCTELLRLHYTTTIIAPIWLLSFSVSPHYSSFMSLCAFLVYLPRPLQWSRISHYAADGETGLKHSSVLNGETLVLLAAIDQRTEVDVTRRRDLVPKKGRHSNSHNLLLFTNDDQWCLQTVTRW